MQDEDYTLTINNLRRILHHVNDCEGLSIMVEKLDEKIVDNIIKTRENTRKENINLMNWAEMIRKRKALAIN